MAGYKVWVMFSTQSSLFCRICRCGAYTQMDGALVHGRANDCDGYEIHYSQKCKWKAYDDFKTGKRVLIRLCKCYKPML